MRIKGAIKTDDKDNANMCILLNYSIADESYQESIPNSLHKRKVI